MRKTMIVLACTAIIFCSCEDEGSSVGRSLVESAFRNVFTDSCTVQMSTILVDSLQTLGDSICQVGYMDDSIFGKVAASYYAEFNVAKFTPSVGKTYVFDSLTLKFHPSGGYWGDTLASQRVHVYPIKNSIVLLTDEYLYNTTEMEVDDELFSFTYTPYPGWKREVEVRMPDEFGQEIFDDILDEKNVFDSQERFHGYFPGLALKPDETGSCMMGISVNDSSMYMKMYYRILDNTITEKDLYFGANTSCAFTHVDHERDGYPVGKLTGGGALNPTPSSQTEKRAYLQGLTGIYNVIEFPYLNNLMTNGDVVSIESATLYLYPEYGTYGGPNQLPTTLRLYVADDDNNTVDQVYNSMGTTIQDGGLTVSDNLPYNTYYTFDLTSFMQGNLGSWGQGRQKLFMILDDNDFVSTFKHVVFTNSASNLVGQTRLDIRFKTYDK